MIRRAAGPDTTRSTGVYGSIPTSVVLTRAMGISQSNLVSTEWRTEEGKMAQVEASEVGKVGAQTRSAKTVLLAEDDVEIRDILQDLLEAEGYDVIPASHGRQALEFLEGSRKTKLPDLVVLDLMMPLVDGVAVLRIMKDDPAFSDIPVVVLSAVARERPAGAAAFLRKPVPLQKFFDTIRDFVDVGVPRLAST